MSNISKYIENAINHGEATNKGDHKKANKCYEKLIEAYLQIRNSGENWIDEFIELLLHENDSVKCWSATHLLKYREQEAIKTLKELNTGKGITSFDAEMVLEEWKKGNLKLP